MSAIGGQTERERLTERVSKQLELPSFRRKISLVCLNVILFQLPFYGYHLTFFRYHLRRRTVLGQRAWREGDQCDMHAAFQVVAQALAVTRQRSF